MLYINITFLSLFIILLLINYLSEFRLLTDNPKKEIRKIHSKKVISIGGVSFIGLILVIPEVNNNFISSFILFSYLFLFFGLLDIKILVNTVQRFFIINFNFYICTFK